LLVRRGARDDLFRKKLSIYANHGKNCFVNNAVSYPSRRRLFEWVRAFLVLCRVRSRASRKPSG